MDLAQRTWHFKDTPSKIFSFNNAPACVSKNVSIDQASVTQQLPRDAKVQNFISKFVEQGSDYEYAGDTIDEIFKDCLPSTYEPSCERSVLFPPLKRMRPDNSTVKINSVHIELNSIDICFRTDEAASLEASQKAEVANMLEHFKDIFENISKPIHGVEHRIDTGEHEPIASAPYRISPAMKSKLRQELDKMLEEGVIDEKESPWAFPVVLIPKKDKTVRVCMDYRRFNAITVTDTYPLPRMEDCLHAAKATPYMSTLDLKSGYWQVKISEEDKLKTAFTTPHGIFVFNRMPFGLKNAPATFQRIIDKFKRSLPKVLILAYLDDIIICSENFKSHIEDLKSVFEKLKILRFHLNRNKCFFCRPRVKYLGYILTEAGLEIDPEKTEAILQRTIPRNLKQLISFLQTCSWFRRYIPNFAEVAKPLSNLTKKKAVWQWNDEQQTAFEKLKLLLSTPPILQQVRENERFYLRTDASNYALGAVLMQGEHQDERPIEYASRLLLPAERNYSTTEREALAVVWAVQKFRGYIEDAEISILTDHQPLRWLFTLKSPTGRLARWSLLLQSYNLTFGYTPGKQNVVADTLSRPPCDDIVCKIECNHIEIELPRIGSAEFRAAQ